MVLSIVEVSQKQAYIFLSNKLKENIGRSAQIAWVTSSGFFSKACQGLYNEADNLVYAGGGHTVLCFSDETKAKRFNAMLSRVIIEDFPDMEIFAKIMVYDEGRTPGDNLKQLTSALEVKKALRRSSFHQGTFGFERIDRTNNFKPARVNDTLTWDDSIKEAEAQIAEGLLPEGYREVARFEDLVKRRVKVNGNYLAVVHIDGNGMGARTANLYKKLDAEGVDWETYRQRIRSYSEAIDRDFKDAYKEMLQTVADADTQGDYVNLPVRRIITSGDDICFVADGRIGIEAARIYIEKLVKKSNAVDGEQYNACAGVALVHMKYPFFRAYELAEELCSNAKRKGAMASPEDNGAGISLIDWHISYGELRDDLEEERRAYRSASGRELFARPYLVDGVPSLGKVCSYAEFLKVSSQIGNESNEGSAAARSRIKSLRSMLKKSDEELTYYKEFYHLEKLMENDRGVLFDAIEVMDLFEKI